MSASRFGSFNPLEYASVSRGIGEYVSKTKIPTQQTPSFIVCTIKKIQKPSV